MGGGGGISGAAVVGGMGVEFRDEEREMVLSVVVGVGRPKTGFVAARPRGSPLAETSNSGKVMKKRQPKVVPKKAPSTAWKRLFGGV